MITTNSHAGDRHEDLTGRKHQAAPDTRIKIAGGESTRFTLPARGVPLGMFVAPTGPNATTTWPSSTTPGQWSLSNASATSRTDDARCSSFWPWPAKAPRRRSRWPLRHPVDCWSAAYAGRAGPSTRSTRWRSPATGNGMRSREPSPATRRAYPGQHLAHRPRRPPHSAPPAEESRPHPPNAETLDTKRDRMS
jgi:hypothetical protein